MRILFTVLTLSLLACAMVRADFYVAPNGSDAWSGALAAPNKSHTDGPFATLERARDAVRALKQGGSLPRGGVTVTVRGGVYELSRPLALEASDSGTAEAPITYRAYPGEEVRLVGGRVVTGWKKVTDASVLQRLDPAARGKVMQADLHALGMTELPKLTTGPSWAQSQPGLELFFQDRPMTLARWPNEGFVKIADINGNTPVDVRGAKGCSDGVFTYEGDRPARWSGEKDVWLHGYWFWDWADQRQPVAAIDAAKHQITLAKPDHAFGYRKGQWYYAFNVLSELDRPGEWYLDRETGILYFWPPSTKLTAGKPMVSMQTSLVTLQDVSHVTLQGFILEAARGTAMTVQGGTHTRVAGCTIRNVGSWAVSITGATDSGVEGCDIYQTGDGGVALSGGDRKTLTPARLYVDNCHIHHYSRWNPVYKAGVRVDGVGNRVSHNLIDNAPHMAINFGGNDHVIEYNEIHSVCFETNDAGAMYAGCDWSQRGHQIRYNYLHHIYGREGRGCVGVYLDDDFSSASITGNVFYQVPSAAFIGGGRDNIIENNIFVECNPAVHVDARGLGWRAYGLEDLSNKVKAMPYRQEPWRSRYPQLLTLLEDEPLAPKGNVIARNICWGGKWDGIEGKAKPFLKLEDNLLDADPLFVNAKRLDFRLRPDSPALKLGFQPIPVEKIGLYKDALRASWPVKSTPLPKPEAPAGAVTPMRRGPAPVAQAKPLSGAVRIDGSLSPAEWGGTPLVLAQGVQGEKQSPQSRAWVARDADALLVAFENEVNPNKPLRLDDVWGENDAVEISLRDPSAGKNAPILVLRGFAGGKFQSSDEAGAPADAVRRAAAGVQYQAHVTDAGHWTAEWRIPFAALGIRSDKGGRVQFNLAVRKTGDDQWLLWQGTGGFTWDVERAGILEWTREKR